MFKIARIALGIVTLALSAELTLEQQRILQQQHTAPAEYCRAVDSIVLDPQFRMLFIERIKHTQIAWSVWQALTPAERQQYGEQRMQYQEDYRQRYEPCWQELAHRWKLQDLDRRVQDPAAGHAYTLQSPWWQGFLVKIPKHYMVDNCIMRPGRWQNVSRVLYSADIVRFAAENNCQYLRPVIEWLYPIPGIYALGVSDDSHWVLSELIADLPSVQDNTTRWHDMIDRTGRQPAIKAAFQELVRELVAVTHTVGLWDHKVHNLFLVPTITGWQFIVIDQEKPGLGGAPDANFYHQDIGEIRRNGKVGLKDFIIYVLGFTKEGLSQGLDMIAQTMGFASWQEFEPTWDHKRVRKDLATETWQWE